MAGAGALLGDDRQSVETAGTAAPVRIGTSTAAAAPLQPEVSCCGRILRQAKCDLVGYLKEYRCGRTAPSAEVAAFVDGLGSAVRAHDAAFAKPTRRSHTSWAMRNFQIASAVMINSRNHRPHHNIGMHTISKRNHSHR